MIRRYDGYHVQGNDVGDLLHLFFATTDELPMPQYEHGKGSDL